MLGKEKEKENLLPLFVAGPLVSHFTGIVTSTEFYLGVNTQNFSSASNREFSQSSVNQVPLRTPFTEEIAIFLLP